jgi:hypothetical protein
MVRLVALLVCLVAVPAAAQRLDRPMTLAPVEAVPRQPSPWFMAPLPDRGLDRPPAALPDDMPRIEPTLLGQRDSASVNAHAPASPGMGEDRLTRQPTPALRLRVPFSD